MRTAGSDRADHGVHERTLDVLRGCLDDLVSLGEVEPQGKEVGVGIDLNQAEVLIHPSRAQVEASLDLLKCRSLTGPAKIEESFAHARSLHQHHIPSRLRQGSPLPGGLLFYASRSAPAKAQPSMIPQPSSMLWP